MKRSLTICLVATLIFPFGTIASAGVINATATDVTPTVPLSNPVATSYQPRYVSGFGSGNSFTLFFEDRDAGGRISHITTTTGPTGFPTAVTATNISDTHFCVKPWPINVGDTDYAYRAWGAVGNNADHHFYVSNDMTNWTLVSTFTIPTNLPAGVLGGWVYYGFHDVIYINGTYYAWGECNQGHTLICRSTNGDDVWKAFDRVGGLGSGPLRVPGPLGGTPTASFFDLGNDRGYGKIMVPGNDSAFYLAINTSAKPSLSPADLETAFINPDNWTWHDGTTGLASTPILVETAEHDLRECWLVPNPGSTEWTVVYDADFGSADGGKALGYAILSAPPPPSEVWVDDDYCDGCYNDGHTWGYDAFDNIQEGIDAVGGSTVHVAAGMYNVASQIVIDKPLNLIGEDPATTIINGPGSLANIPYYGGGMPCPGLIAVDGVSGSLSIKNFTLQEAPMQDSSGNTELLVVRYMPAGASATIENNIFIGRNDNSVLDEGIWIAEGEASSQVVIKNNDFSRTCWMAICLERMLGASTVENNEIHNLVAWVYGGDTYAAWAIVFLTYGGDIMTQQLVKGNTFRDFAGQDIQFWGGHFLGDGRFTNVKIQNNTINAIGSGSVEEHFGIGLYNWAAAPAAGGVHNADISANTVTTGGAGSKGVVIQGQNTGITLTDNEVTNLDIGIHVEGTGAPDVSAHCNRIAGNTTWGLKNDAETDVDAECNWWGSADGPSGVGPGSGDPVSSNVDYDPWLPAPFGPIIANVTPYMVAVNTDFQVTADVAGCCISSVEYSIDYLSMSGPMSDSEPDGTFTSGTISGGIDTAGVYDLCISAEDCCGNVSEECIMLAVYDPEGGFVTGGGWIWSPAGAYADDAGLEGRANFGFVSKYKKGANVPTGNTEFVFEAGDLDFHSSSYHWLVVTGSDYARFKGTGTINGSGEYKFMLWAGDGEPDTFRIKIWTEDQGGVETIVYDNGSDQAIEGGNIVIHTPKAGK